ncbi:hypothetical protein E2C01_098245 [Portunus trituberculatus]|uniref:Uncharacterized protein n=1 Tax=Portunus trituberculatus TaxID=210409 RepID=A0A5B7KCF2_PORTR|nr:hypothetical protein [Portunus trituberculatus]
MTQTRPKPDSPATPPATPPASPANQPRQPDPPTRPTSQAHPPPGLRAKIRQTPRVLISSAHKKYKKRFPAAASALPWCLEPHHDPADFTGLCQLPIPV